MIRSSTLAPALLVPLALVGCSDAGDGLDAGAGDAGTNLPDARVLQPADMGVDNGPAPTLTRVTPSAGPTSGGTRVTLRGTAFSEPLEVFFGTQPAASVALLDDRTVAATSPEGTLGVVRVAVTTAGGTAELPNAFTYVRELRLDAVTPSRVPDEGGIEVTVSGKGFTPETVVLFDRKPLRGRTVVSEEQITGWMPSVTAGRPEVRVITGEGAVRRSDVVVAFGTPEVALLAPGYGPTSGGALQEVAGDGFADASAVRFGGLEVSELSIRSDERLTALAPALAAGPHDVTIENADTTRSAPGLYVAFDPARLDFNVAGVTPAAVPQGSVTAVSVVGGGFLLDTKAVLDGRALTVRRLSTNVIEVELPADVPVGPASLEISSGSSRATVVLEVLAAPQITGLQPGSGPAAGGTMVTISGSGFVTGMSARLGDVPLADVSVVDANTLTARTVAGSHGPATLELRVGEQRAVLEGAFRFEEPFEVVRVEPTEGSIAGNTYVSVIGRGFGTGTPGELGVDFGTQPGLEAQLENGGVLGVRAPAAAAGLVNVSVRAGAGRDAALPDAYTYFNPRLLAGGAWGGPIEGAVNVAVLDNDGQPLPGFTVQLGSDADARYRRLTDANGLATISSPEIRGAQTVTVGREGQEFVTFMDIDARNLTMFSAGYPQIQPPDAPVFPCPEGQQPPVIRGRIFELKSALDPETNPDVIPVVRITYTQSNVFSPNPPEPAEQFDFVFEEGEEYEIVVMRAGTVAVYAILGDFNQTTQEFIPRQMGIARGIPVAPETVTDGIDIALDIEMNQTLRVRLDNPPNQNPGPSLSAVFPYLNLDSDGVIPFDAAFVPAGGELILRNMPALAESQFFYMGGSFTQGANGLASPYSLTLVESSADAEDGVDLGPYLEMPTNVRPKAGELLTDGRISWDQGGPTPDLTTLSVVDVGAAGGQCCLDFNMNGQCDEGEPLQGGALPVQFNRWSLYAEGGMQSYELPRMPLDVQAFEAPQAYAYLLQLAIAPRFSWEEFAYNQFSPFFWQSWVVWSSQFTVKEETD